MTLIVYLQSEAKGSCRNNLGSYYDTVLIFSFREAFQLVTKDGKYEPIFPFHTHPKH